MTRQQKQKVHCLNCGVEITAETSFGRWIRNHPDLDSNTYGLSVMDMDYVIHRFRSELGRDFQLLMIVEVKTRGSQMSDAQRDTAHVLNQITRNRRQTPTKPLRYQAGTAPLMIYSIYAKRKVFLKVLGVHVLTFEGLGPDDSRWIKWDNREIDASELAALIRFDIDPDTLEPMQWRVHHEKVLSVLNQAVTLFSDAPEE